MWSFFKDEKYEKERTLANSIINKLTKELECETLPDQNRERKELILKCIKYYYSL